MRISSGGVDPGWANDALAVIAAGLCTRIRTIHCQEIFDGEPEKYVQSWLPVHQIYQGHCFKPGTDPTAKGFDPLMAVLAYYEMEVGRDNFDFEGSEDQKNFAAWRGESVQGDAK